MTTASIAIHGTPTRFELTIGARYGNLTVLVRISAGRYEMRCDCGAGIVLFASQIANPKLRRRRCGWKCPIGRGRRDASGRVLVLRSRRPRRPRLSNTSTP